MNENYIDSRVKSFWQNQQSCVENWSMLIEIFKLPIFGLKDIG